MEYKQFSLMRNNFLFSYAGRDLLAVADGQLRSQFLFGRHLLHHVYLHHVYLW